MNSLCSDLGKIEIDKKEVKLLISRYGHGYDSSTVFKLINLEPRKVGIVKKGRANLSCD